MALPDLAFRIALLVMCGFSLFACASLAWMFLRARFPLLNLPRPKPAHPPAGQGVTSAPARKAEPEKPAGPERVRMIGGSVAVGENTRNRIVLRGQ